MLKTDQLSLHNSSLIKLVNAWRHTVWYGMSRWPESVCNSTGVAAASNQQLISTHHHEPAVRTQRRAARRRLNPPSPCWSSRDTPHVARLDRPLSGHWCLCKSSTQCKRKQQTTVTVHAAYILSLLCYNTRLALFIVITLVKSSKRELLNIEIMDCITPC